ncbi:unnamed protein product [Withania somnifera]
MQKSGNLVKNNSLRVTTQQSLRRLGLCSQITAGQHSSPVVFPEKRSKGRSVTRGELSNNDPKKEKIEEHRIEIGDEQSDLLGYEVFSGKLVLDKGKAHKNSELEASKEVTNQDAVEAKLTSKALVWGSGVLHLEDVISVSHCPGLRHFTIHSYPLRRGSGALSCFLKTRRSRRTFLAGFKLEVVKTTSAGHARKLASTVDFSTCPDGIICVGGDGIVNEVLNGLLTRDNQKEAISVPIGIIPAGSDNSLVWTVLGVRDPVSAAIAIVKGGLTPTDVFAVEWLQSGRIHFGTTVTYFGFVSDVLELSDKYQKRFGPLRYFVAGFLKFMCLPKYSFEVEYFPAVKEATGEGKASVIDMSELYTDIMRRSSKEGLPRASSLSSIDSIMTPSRMSGADMDTTCSSTEPSEYVRAVDAKSKRLSAGRSGKPTSEPEVIHPQLPLSVTPNWPRTRSKSKTDKGWTGLTAANDPTRSSWANTTTNDKEDISSTMSDPGPIWDSEPRWDTEPRWNVEDPIELPGPADDTEGAVRKDIVQKSAEEWVTTKGQFLGVLICNHSCKTVQSLSSQVVAPKAEPDDNTLDLLLVHGSGRLKLLRFFLLLQMGRHLSLPYVEYVKVKAVKVKPGKHSNGSCGIDGELFPVNEQVISSLLTEQCRLIGRAPGNCK